MCFKYKKYLHWNVIFFSFLINSFLAVLKGKKKNLWAHSENADAGLWMHGLQVFFVLFFAVEIHLKFRAPRQSNCLEDLCFFLYLQTTHLNHTVTVSLFLVYYLVTMPFFSVHSFFNNCNWRKRKELFLCNCESMWHFWCILFWHQYVSTYKYIFLNNETTVYSCVFLQKHRCCLCFPLHRFDVYCRKDYRWWRSCFHPALDVSGYCSTLQPDW